MSTTQFMSIDDAIQKAYSLARGKDTIGTPLAAGDSKYKQLLQIADVMQKTWMNTDGVEWQSLWKLFRLADVVAVNTDTYALPVTLRTISSREQDSVIITATDGVTFWEYDIISPNQLNQFAMNPPQAAAQVGTNLQFAHFIGKHAFMTSDPAIGGTIDVPGYQFVSDINANSNTSTQTVQVDDPMWLVYMMAGEFVRTDLVRQAQYPNLLNLAQDRMDAMLANNGGQLDEIPIDMDFSDIDPNSSGAWS